MLKVFYAILLGLIGAGVVHIAILLMVPQFSERDAWSRLAGVSDFYTITRLDAGSGGAAIVKSGDPMFYEAACRFDLSSGVALIRGSGRVPFWSASVYNRGGENIYSFNDRSTESGDLDFVVLTPQQMIETRKELPEDFQKSVFVEAAIEEGIVVVRAFVPDESWKPGVARFLAGLSCTAR